MAHKGSAAYVEYVRHRIVASGGLPADCHPLRRAFRGGACRACFQQGQGRLVPGDPRPPSILGLLQRVYDSLPRVCPKCQAPAPAWRIAGHYASCLICGFDSFLSSGRAVTLRAAREHANERRS